MIDIDTIKLLELTMTLRRANDRIDEAVSMLQSIHTHHDWGCPERHVINDYIRESTGIAIILQDDCLSFVKATRTVANEFVETEKGIASLFDSVEDVIKKILMIPISRTIVNGVPEHIKPRNIANLFAWRQMNTIPVIKREDINIGHMGGR